MLAILTAICPLPTLRKILIVAAIGLTILALTSSCGHDLNPNRPGDFPF